LSFFSRLQENTASFVILGESTLLTLAAIDQPRLLALTGVGRATAEVFE
jgi:hypothetical protein